MAIKGIYAGTQEYLDIIGKEVQNLSTTYVPFATATEAEIYAAIQPNTKVREGLISYSQVQANVLP